MTMTKVVGLVKTGS